MFEGSLNSKVLFVSDFQRVHCKAEGRVLSSALRQNLESAMRTAGLLSADVSFYCLHDHLPPGGKDIARMPVEVLSQGLEAFRVFLGSHSANIIVPLGEYAMSVVCGLQSIQKWHSYITQTKAEFGMRKAMPMFHPDYIQRAFNDSAYISFGMLRVRDEMQDPKTCTPKRTFLLGPDFQTTMDYLRNVVAKAPELAVDIETGGGLINTVGFAISATEAVAIKTLPEFYSVDQHFELWQLLGQILSNEQPKILQNFIYEATWFARYGIEMKTVKFDTMWAMKFLHPEFEKGLHNVGRIYTPYPYWKDDNDNWANIKDWQRHLDYNCKDTTGTFAGYESQTRALQSRELGALFNDYVMRFAPPIQEMCVTGLNLDLNAWTKLKEKLDREQENYMRIIDFEFDSRLQRKVNVRSPKQLKDALKELKIKVPTSSKKGQAAKETTDKKALFKLRKKYPDEPILPALIGISAVNKQLSSYTDFEFDRRTNKVHYSLDGCGTETGRWSGNNSGWGEGFNPQTVPKAVRNCFKADEGKVLIQVDLSQAESRYVAWESADAKLMDMLEQGLDVHRYVAGQIFNKPPEIVSKAERQLGKKSGHSANYCVGPRTFAESCLVEMNMALSEHEAKRIIETYYAVFPGVRRRQENIRREIYNKRFLKTPLGRERYFYGRMDDATFREAYAYAPQSVIPDITNHLMLKLWDNRDYLGLSFEEGNRFLLQVHDSLLLQVDPHHVADIAALARDLKSWHPKIMLPGGELWIPVDVEVGQAWGKMEKPL